MTLHTKTLLVSCCVVPILAMPARLVGQDSLGAARQLYASAEYQSALAMLSGLLAADPSPQERQSIELYRVFCLFAVGNLGEANRTLEAMIRRDPMYRPDMEEVPRRLRPSFSDARRRLLPSVIEETYLAAKAAFDRDDFKAAVAGFTQTLMVLSDPDIAPDVEQRPLADFRVLATGFNELAVRAMAPPTAPPVDAPVREPEPPVVPAPGIYDSRDANVSAPVVVRQVMPPFRGPVFAPRVGQIDVVIDETGAVESAMMTAPLDPRYDALVLAAAKTWQYEPARLDGVPVKFRKSIQLTISPDR